MLLTIYLKSTMCGMCNHKENDITCMCQECAKRACGWLKDNPKVFLSAVQVFCILKDVEWKYRKAIAEAILLIDFPIDDDT